MKNRWVVLAAGCIIQAILGGIYAWSTFVPYLLKTYADSLNSGRCGFIFGVTILTFTIAMIPAGWVLAKKGPRLTAGLGALLFMSGYLLASISKGSFPMLVLGLGIIAGAGIGFGYVSPLSAGMKWFPKKKGLVTGISVAGFGGGAILLASSAEYVLSKGMDVLILFRWLGLGSGVLVFVAAWLLAMPASSKSEVVKVRTWSKLRTWPFCLTAISMFAGTFAGLLLISNLIPLLIKIGLPSYQAAVCVSVFAAGNALGRIIWGQLFDYFGYKSIPISLGAFALIITAMLFPLPLWAIILIVGLLGFGFGANFVVYASTISRYFGATSFPRLYPVCFLAYGVAGLIGPGFGGYLADITGTYHLSLYICLGLVVFAGILSFMKLNVYEQ